MPAVTIKTLETLRGFAAARRSTLETLRDQFLIHGVVFAENPSTGASGVVRAQKKKAAAKS